MPAPVPKRRFMHGETAFLMEYLRATYPGRRTYLNIRVGPIEPHVPRADLTVTERKLMGAWRRFADAVVEMDREAVVVESTIRKAVEKVGPLLEYLDLVPQTPELSHLRGLPLRAELVSPLEDPRAAALCARLGIRFVVFKWSRLEEFQSAYEQRFRRVPLSDVRRVL